MFTPFDYEHVVLIPKECKLDTRADADVSAKLGGRAFRIPLMTSNMPSIINEELAIELAKRNYFYVMHRYGVDPVAFVKKMKSLNLYASISVGVVQEHHNTIDELKKEGLVPEYINIEIAHGHSKTVKTMIEHVRSAFSNETFIIAGNVATPEALVDLENWGADAVRVGLGPGYVCTTTPRTGFGTRGWQLSAVKRCAEVAKKVVIADGGLRNSGDIAKTIRMGAHWVMSGYFFSGHIESPGEITVIDGKKLKCYYGNASAQCKRSSSRVEGISTYVPCETSLYDKLIEVEQDLQSSVSYAGGTKLEDIKKVDYLILK